MTCCQYMHIPSHLTVILNASAGGSDKEGVCQRLTKIFGASGLEAEIALAHSGAEAMALARRAEQRRGEALVAGGGDGTINAVASALVGTDRPLGILPLGTLNHFAKDLQIPLELEAAAQTIMAGWTVRVDVGEVNGLVFLNNSSLGIYPHLVVAREGHQRRGLSKWLAFGLAVLSVLYRYPTLRVRLHIDEQEQVRTTPMLFVGNNAYEWEGLNMGARMRLDQGVLSVYVLHQTRRWELPPLFLRLFIRTRREAIGLDALNTTELRVEPWRMRRRVRVALDGEVTVLPTPLHYRIRPAALRVIVPPPTAAPSR